MKMLAVDDSSMMRKLISQAAAVLGYETIQAQNGLQALEFLQVNPEGIELITLDINMPVMDGFTLLTKIKQDSKLKHIPVMMVTSDTERQSIVRAIKAGAQHYITKPFTTEELASKIAECLGMGA